MKLQGNVKGHIYVVTQQAYDGPIDGTRPCKWCGAKFEVNRNRQYCSDRCRNLAYAEKNRESSKRYNARKARERRAVI